MSRAYVPATRPLLAAWHAAGGVPADAERVVAPADDEDSEYAALMTAADLATALGPADGRRVVVVADAPGDADRDLPLATWAAVHADTADRTPDGDPDDDLLWFGVQEIAAVLAG
ncbi:hypothetical protein GCM10009623_08810 [Nocardioides aestuarii]|uniref:DUF6912 family protein n=1 Tax=Nocardioides aestuarii TaxID=252231 RepID=A0ABW4TEW3_9ACTN